jgi:hypothetical protein
MVSLQEHFLRHHCGHLLKTVTPDREDEIVHDISSALQEGEASTLIQELLETAKAHALLWNTLSNRRKRRLESAERFGRTARQNLHSHLKRMRQWAALRRLNAAFSRRHKQFLLLARYSRSPVLRELLGRYYEAAEVLESAVLTFKDMLAGTVPVSLREVYYFINLAFSMAETMRSSGCLVSFDPWEGDFQTWRNCLREEAEQLAFDELVAKLWSKVIPQDGELLEWETEARSLV